MSCLPPLASDLPAEALRILAAARRIELPCGSGQLVWHAWGEGEPLVLLHGGSGSWTHWIRNIEALVASGRRLLLPDLPGFGDSAPAPGGSDADAVGEALAPALRELAGGPCDVVGFSFGGLTAGLLAARQPELLRRLVIVGAPGMRLRPQRLALTSWREQPDEAGRLAAHRSNLAALMLHAPAAIDDLALQVHAANVVRDRNRGRNLAMTDILARTLPTLACPVDAIYGREDVLVRDQLDELATTLARAPYFGELVLLPDAGHWVQYEAPQAFNRALLRLLAAR